MRRSRELMDKVLLTWDAYHQATVAFDAINQGLRRGGTLGMEHPDGTQAIKNAGRARRKAASAFRQALKEYTDYLTTGEPPRQT
jgi:hypothetical protein